uniref:Uncharacterized protein n=1 Tax=Peronospora matthiolae TaxID=2874970 RepID=A0AAV1UQA2_9STRA
MISPSSTPILPPTSCAPSPSVVTQSYPAPSVGVDVSPRGHPTGPDSTTDAVEGTSVSGGPIGPASRLDAVVNLASSTEPIGSTLTLNVLDSSAASDEPIGVGESATTTDPMISALTLDVVDNFAASGDPIGAIPLPTTRVETPIVHETNAVGIIAGLYQRLASQQYLVDSYRDLDQALREQTRRGDRLERELRSLTESASPFAIFAQTRCNRLRLDLKDALAEVALLQERIRAGGCYEQQISDLKSKLLKTTRSLYPFKERSDLELASLRRHMDEGNARFQAALLKAKSKRAKYKADCTKAQTTVRHLHAAFAAVSVERDQLRDDLAELEADYDRSRSMLSDCDDRVGLLQATISGLELERDQALRDRDALRTSIAALVTGPNLPP